MTTVDSLDIKISAEINKANAAITTLSNKLDRLSSSLSGVNSRGLATLGAGVNKLANAMSNFSVNTKTADFSRISKNIKTLNSVDGSNLAKLSANLSSLSKGISSIGTVSFNAESLNAFASSIRKIGNVSSGDGIANLSKLKNELSSFINGINSIPPLTFNATGLSGLISSISRFGGKNATQSVKNLPNITKYLKQFVVEMNGVGNISFNASGMGDLISAVSRLGGKASTQAITNIPLLADAMKDFMKTLSTAPKVSQNLIDITNAMAKFAKTGSSGAKAANTLGTSIKTMGKKIAGVPNIIKSFNRNTIKMGSGLKNLVSQLAPIASFTAIFGGIKKSLDVSSDLAEVQNVVDVTFGDFKNKIEDLSKTSVADFGMSELTAKQMAGRFQAMGTAMGFSQEKMSDMSVELTKLAGDMASFYNVEQDAVATSLQSVFTGETEPLRKYGLDLTQATLQEWALKNGLDANIQSMSQMEKTMLRYQYVTANTGAAQGDFLRTQDSWANQTRILKQNLEALAGVIGGTLINALKPFVKAMNVALGYITAFAKTVSNALGKIFGWTYEESGGGLTSDFEGAADASDSIADSTGTAANNIKKMQAGLRAFDELKTIEMPDMSDSGTGGGGSAGGLGGAGGGAAGDGKWTQGNSIIKQFESEIDSLYKLGQYIGDALSEAMESIDWDSIYEKARNFGSGLASFLNGLISPRLFENLGLTVAGAINTALHFLDSFGETFDWSNFGESLGTGLTSFLNGIDWNTALSAASNWGTGIAKALNKFISSKTFSSVGNAVAMALNTAIQFVLDLGMEFDFKNFGKSIASAVNNFFSTFEFGDLAETLNVWVDGIEESIGTAIQNIEWGKVLSGLNDFLSNLEFDTISVIIGSIVIKNSGKNLAKLLGEAILSKIGLKGITIKSLSVYILKLLPTLPAGGAGTPSIDVIGNWIADGISDVLEKLMPKKLYDFLSKNLATAFLGAAAGLAIGNVPGAIIGFLLGGLADAFWQTIGGWEGFKGANKEIVEKIFNWDETKQHFYRMLDWFDFSNDESVWQIGKDIINGIKEGFLAAFSFLTEPITDFFKWVIDGICDVFGIHSPAKEMEPLGDNILKGVVEGFKGAFGEMTKAIEDFWNNYIKPWFTKEKWLATSENIKEAFNEKWEQFTDWFSNTAVVDFFENKVKPKFSVEYWKSKLGSLKEALKNKWDEMTDWFSNTAVVKFFENDVKPWFSKEKWDFSGVKDGLESAFNNAIDGIKGIWNSFAGWINKALKLEFDGFSKEFNVLGEKIKIGIPEFNVTLGKLPTFKMGGYVPKSYTTFIAGENGVPEMLGTVGGKTAVAGGAEITGIKDAIIQTSQQEIALLRQQNQLLQGILEKEYGISKNDIGHAAQDYSIEYFRRTGKSAYVY